MEDGGKKQTDKLISLIILELTYYFLEKQNIFNIDSKNLNNIL